MYKISYYFVQFAKILFQNIVLNFIALHNRTEKVTKLHGDCKKKDIY